MCVNCASDGIGRRDFMKFSAAGAIALGVGGAPPAARAAEGAPTALSPRMRSRRSNRAMSAT